MCIRDSYVIIGERFGNSSVDLVALDCDAGDPIRGAPILTITAPYDWDTGFSTPNFGLQSMHVTIISVDLFGIDSLICGFEIATQAADFNITVTGVVPEPPNDE